MKKKRAGVLASIGLALLLVILTVLTGSLLMAYRQGSLLAAPFALDADLQREFSCAKLRARHVALLQVDGARKTVS